MCRNDIVPVVLSAGQSSRMGRDKALLEIGGSTVIQKILSDLSEVFGRIHVVLGENYDEVVSNIALMKYSAEVNCIFNENHHLGMFSSIQKGLASVPKDHPALLQMVDQPFIPISIYRELMSTYSDEYYVYQPSNDGKAGHPLLLSGEFVRIVLSYKVTTNLKKIIGNLPKKRKFLEVDCQGILQNLNTPLDFERAVKDYDNGNIDS